jgi:hypothetical protein
MRAAAGGRQRAAGRGVNIQAPEGHLAGWLPAQTCMPSEQVASSETVPLWCFRSSPA